LGVGPRAKSAPYENSILSKPLKIEGPDPKMDQSAIEGKCDEDDD
jgi:hypothetical protein